MDFPSLQLNKFINKQPGFATGALMQDGQIAVFSAIMRSCLP